MQIQPLLLVPAPLPNHDLCSLFGKWIKKVDLAIGFFLLHHQRSKLDVQWKLFTVPEDLIHAMHMDYFVQSISVTGNDRIPLLPELFSPHNRNEP